MNWQTDFKKQQLEASWDGDKVWKDSEQEAILKGWGSDPVITEEIYFRKRFGFIFKHDMFDHYKFPWDSQNSGCHLNWKWLLLEMFPNHVKKWWDPKRWNSYVIEDLEMSFYEQCNKTFDIWFDKSKLNWKTDIDYLFDHCMNHFNKWYDSTNFDWNKAMYLLSSKVAMKNYKLWIEDYKEAVVNDKFDLDLMLNWGY